MEVQDILSVIDAEIAKLQQARALLGGSAELSPPVKKAGRGRPKGSKNASADAQTAAPAKTTKRSLSPEGRKAIAEAMKRRWAERRKQAPK